MGAVLNGGDPTSSGGVQMDGEGVGDASGQRDAGVDKVLGIGTAVTCSVIKGPVTSRDGAYGIIMGADKKGALGAQSLRFLGGDGFADGKAIPARPAGEFVDA